MATTVLAPASFAQAQSDLGFSYVFAAQAIREEITERLSVLDLGLMDAVGDFEASGSDTIRITRYGGLGFAERMTAMATESDPIVATGHNTAYDTLTVARYGLAKEETLQSMVLGRSDSVDLDLMQSKVPESFLATLRYLMCVEGQNFSAGVGTSGAAWTYDDELELRSSYHETEGFDTLTRPVYSVRHPEQFTDLAHSLRNEPAFQGSELLRQLLGLQRNEGGAIDVLGIRSFGSHDVQNSGGDHVGFSYVAGAIVWGAPSTAGLAGRVSDDTDNLIIPEIGTILRRTGNGKTANERFDVNSWFGVDALDPTLYPQFTLTSVND